MLVSDRDLEKWTTTMEYIMKVDGLTINGTVGVFFIQQRVILKESSTRGRKMGRECIRLKKEVRWKEHGSKISLKKQSMFLEMEFDTLDDGFPLIRGMERFCFQMETDTRGIGLSTCLISKGKCYSRMERPIQGNGEKG